MNQKRQKRGHQSTEKLCLPQNSPILWHRSAKEPPFLSVRKSCYRNRYHSLFPLAPRYSRISRYTRHCSWASPFQYSHRPSCRAMRASHNPLCTYPHQSRHEVQAAPPYCAVLAYPPVSMSHLPPSQGRPLPLPDALPPPGCRHSRQTSCSHVCARYRCSCHKPATNPP